MKRSDSILQNYYMGKLPKYQQRPGTVDEDAIRAYMMGLSGRAPKQVPKSVPKGLTQIPAQDQFYQNQLQKYGRTREDIERSRQEAALPFLLATGAIGAAAAAPLLATVAPAIGAGLSYAPIASAPAATLGNLLTSAGVAGAITNLPNTDRSLQQAFRTGKLDDIGQAAMNVGLTAVDLLPAYGPLGKQLINVAQHPLVSTLPYVVSRNAIPEYIGAAGISAVNRLSPVLSTNPITKGLYKKAAERVASISLGQSRELPQIAKALFTNKPGTYTGIVGGNSTPERNLIRNYVYGDTRGFEASDLPVTGLEKYFKRYGPLEKYKLNTSIIGEDAYPIESLMAQVTDVNNSRYADELLSINNFDDRVNRLKDIIKREGTISIGSESSGIGSDDIAGHMKFLSYDPAADAYNVRTQDIWKFTPEDYNKKWGLDVLNRSVVKQPSFDLKTYLNNYMKSKQASLMDKAGKPFILLDERPISITPSPDRQRYVLDMNMSDYTVGELEEMGLTPSEIKDVINKKNVVEYDFSSIPLQFKETTNTSRKPFRKQGGPIVNQRGFMDGIPPQGSNWRIMGDGIGTSITMDLPNMPDEILVVPDGDFGQAKVMKQGEEEYFMGADFVDEYLLKDGGLTPNKAREILHDKEVHGRPLTEKQRRYFGAISKGHTKKYQIGGKTDEEKRALAKRTVEIARRRAAKGEWVDVPQSIRDAAERLDESANSCIGGVCDVLKEAEVIPNVIWSNTEFARLAPKLGFNAANRGWGLKGIENLEPGDVVQWMDSQRGSKKAVPHHGQIYLGTNKEGELEFFDNYNREIRSYPKEKIEEQLSWTAKPLDSQMQIYKINPYNPKSGNVNPEAQKALEERAANLRYQTGYAGILPEYAYSLRPDSPYYNNPPIGMVKFMDKANDSEFIDDVVKSIDKAGYAKRATREQVHDSLLNVFGILGQENKWENPWVGGDITGGSSPIPIPLESTVERIASPSSMSIGPGQIKFSQISKAVKKAFGINRRQDLQNWDKVIPLMVGLDIANKQWMENQGERFSERIIGQPGLRSTEFKWDEGRISPYFFRGPGIKNIRKYVESLYGKDWYDKFKPQYMQDVEDMEEDPVKREQFVKDNIRQYQLVFDPGSYGQRVFENINRNLQRKILRFGQTDAESIPENATKLQEVILTSKRPPSRQLGGNALGMLRDYGGGISVPPKYQQRPGTVREPIIVSDPQDRRLTRYNDSLALYNNYVYNKNLIESTLRPQFKKMGYRDIKKYTEPYNSDRNFFELPDGSSTLLSYGKNERVTAPQYKTDTDVANPLKVVRRKVGTITVPEHEELWSTSIAPVRTIRYNPADVLYTTNKNYIGDIYSIDKTELVPYDIRKLEDSPRKRQMLKERAEFVKSWPYIITPTKSNYSFVLDEYVKPVQPVVYQQLVTKLEKLKEPEPTVKNKTPLIDYFQGTSVFAPTPYHGSGAGAFVGYRTPQGDTVFVKPEDYERMGVPKYGREFIESQIKKQKNGGQHGGLDRWFAEKWVDVKTGKPCGRQEGESRAYPACRPSKRVSSKTPKTSSELSSAEKEKFKRSKTSSERIPYSHKRRK